jgi:hypothetical protein
MSERPENDATTSLEFRQSAPRPETVEVPVCRQCLGEGGYYVVEPANPDMKVWLSCTVCRPNALSARPIRPETVEVPVEATNEMCEHGSSGPMERGLPAITTSQADAAWAAMLAARPTTADPTDGARSIPWDREERGSNQDAAG